MQLSTAILNKSCIYIYIYTRMHTCTHARTHMHARAHTHTHITVLQLYDFVRDNPGELVPEETLTNSHLLWSSIVPYLLHPFNMIHGILYMYILYSLEKGPSEYNYICWKDYNYITFEFKTGQSYPYINKSMKYTRTQIWNKVSCFSLYFCPAFVS